MRINLDPASVPIVRVFVQPFRLHDDKGLFFLATVSFLLFCLGLCFQANGSYDTDGWFLLATGRRIVEHGIPYVNPWSLESGRPIVVQQWLHDVMLYGFWSAFGFAGTVVYQCLMALCVIAALVFAIRGILGGSPNFRYLMFSAAVGMSGAGLYISVRPTPWSMVAFLATVGLCARYRRTRDRRLLVALPLVTFLHVQMQSAMVALDIFVACCFLGIDIVSGFWRHSSPSTDILCANAPMALSILLMAGATLLNPYGLDGALYVVNGMGAASYGNVISEMKGAIPATHGHAAVFLLLYTLVPALLLRSRLSRVDNLPLLLLLIAGLVATLLHWRNVWILALASSVLSAAAFDVDAEAVPPRLSMPVLSAMAILAVLIANVLPTVQRGGRTEWQIVDDALSPIAERLSTSDIKDPKVYSVDPFVYNYLEWRGLKVPFDLRPEIWDAKASDGTVRSPYRDYVDSLKGVTAKATYLRESGFDYYIVGASDFSSLKSTVPVMKVMRSKGYILIRKSLRGR